MNYPRILFNTYFNNIRQFLHEWSRQTCMDCRLNTVCAWNARINIRVFVYQCLLGSVIFSQMIFVNCYLPVRAQYHKSANGIKYKQLSKFLLCQKRKLMSVWTL
jgi:hypothetical protein